MPRLAFALTPGLACLPVPMPALAEEAPVAAPTMTAAERTAFRDEVRAYLLENPEVLFEALDILQSREEAAKQKRDTDSIAASADQIFNNPDDWVSGNPDADVTLVEFMDYRCSYCRQA